MLGAGRRLLTRVLARRGDAPYSPPSIQFARPVRTSQSGPGLFRTLGRFWLAVEQPHRAQRWFERAVRRGDAHSLVNVGDALLAGGPVQLANIEYVGLEPTVAGDPERAAPVFRAALDAEVSPRTARRGLATSLLRQDMTSETLACIDDIDELDDLRATALIRQLEQRQAKSRSALREITPILERHLARRPGDMALRDRLARIHISLLQFDDALAVASLTPPPSPAAHLAEWTQATSAGDHQAAHQMKQRAARQLAAAPARRTGSLGELMIRTQAANYVDGPEAALEAIEHRWLWIPTETERRARERLRADLLLLCGDVQPLRTVALNAPALDDSIAERFDNMISGRRVLVVGPSPSHRPSAAIQSAHDVVVTTRRHDLGNAAQASIAYLNDESFLVASLNDDDSREMGSHITVLRPSIVKRRTGSADTLRGVRIQPFEDSTPLLGTHFAIQRIIHDLIGHGAASITLSGLDFFLGEQTYVGGYHEGDLDRFASVPFNAAHDFAYAFWYTKRLHDLGIVESVAGVSELLDRDVDTYLGELGRVFL